MGAEADEGTRPLYVATATPPACRAVSLTSTPVEGPEEPSHRFAPFWLYVCEGDPTVCLDPPGAGEREG